MTRNNSTETKGLTVENQTKGLNSVNNDDMVSNPNSLNGEFQHVLISCQIDVAVRLLNNLFMNVGEGVMLSPSDDWERINDVSRHLCDYPLKQHHLLGNRSQHLDINDDSTVLVLDNIYYSGFDGILVFRVYSGDNNMWSEIIKSYQNVEWIVDHYDCDDDNPSGHTIFPYIGSTLMEHKGGKIKIHEFDIQHIDELEERFPIHGGYLKLRRERDQIKILEGRMEKDLDMASDEVNKDELYIMTIQYDVKYETWRHRKKELMCMPEHDYLIYDPFCPYYIDK